MTRKEYVNECKQHFNQFLEGKKVLIKYIKNKKSERVGVIVAFKAVNDVLVGVSRCNKNSGDRWNKYVGISKAINSAVPIEQVSELNVPRSAVEIFNHQLERVSKYYKLV